MYLNFAIIMLFLHLSIKFHAYDKLMVDLVMREIELEVARRNFGSPNVDIELSRADRGYLVKKSIDERVQLSHWRESEIREPSFHLDGRARASQSSQLVSRG